MNSDITPLSRAQGALLGLAVGDALGTTLEFKPRGTFEPISDMVGGGPFRLAPGLWTDDTSMAICLAESLLAQQGFDPRDQMERYVRWWKQGENSSTGRCFDIGTTVLHGLQEYLHTGKPYSGSKSPMAAGNGSLMRLAPVVLFYFPDLSKTINYAGESSRTTHAAEECVDACGFFATLLFGALKGLSQVELLALGSYQPMTKKVGRIKAAEYLGLSADAIKGSGYVIESLEAALWCFFTTKTFSEAVLAAANLGDDADTTAAICGQLAGAHYGIEGIPAHWLEKLWERDRLMNLATALHHAQT